MKQWRRRHANGWFAVVSVSDEGRYTANAMRYEETRAGYGFLAIATFDDAKRLADALVPAHECACGDWFEVKPSRR
jgi:hypothetical protein